MHTETKKFSGDTDVDYKQTITDTVNNKVVTKWVYKNGYVKQTTKFAANPAEEYVEMSHPAHGWARTCVKVNGKIETDFFGFKNLPKGAKLNFELFCSEPYRAGAQFDADALITYWNTVGDYTWFFVQHGWR